MTAVPLAGSRRAAWTPGVRPDWVRAVNDRAARLDLPSIVPLTPESLIASAVAATGLSDFGADEWREGFAVSCRALDEEAGLNMMGRVLTRADMIATLVARLRVEDAYKRLPQIEDEEIAAPLLIMGQGRTGTSALLNLLAADPANAITRAWQVMYPTPAIGAEDEALAIAAANAHVALWNEVAPDLQSVHEFTGEIPTESIHAQSLTFEAPAWQLIYGQVPSLYAFMAARSRVPSIAYEKRVLKLLQYGKPKRRWILKSPDALNYLPDVLQVYPDMGLVWTHRDPIKAMSSAISVVSTLAWARSDRPLAPGVASAITDLASCAAMLTQPIGWLESGVLPVERIVHVLYQDFVENPLGVVRAIYRHFGIPETETSFAALQDYVTANPRTLRPAHRYSLGEDAGIAEERRVFQEYQAYFGVASEL